MADTEASELNDEPTAEASAHPTSAPATDVRRRRARRREDYQDDVPFHAAARSTPERSGRALENARVAARIADDSRAKDILLLDLRPVTALVDFFVVVTASSRRLSNAIASEIDQEMKRRGEHKLGIEGAEEGRWVLIDYGDFVVHVFSEESRTYYALEDIWGDANRLDWADPDRPQAKPRAEVETEAAPELDPMPAVDPDEPPAE